MSTNAGNIFLYSTVVLKIYLIIKSRIILNKFGLKRTIPLPIKRKIRQHCHFGCVVCGSAIIEYEHVDPEYHEAMEHDPEKMTLLCPQCHAKVTRGLLSKDTVKKAMKHPKCQEVGFSREILDITNNCLEIQYGINGLSMKNISIPIQINQTPLMKIEKPNSETEPYQLSCIFYDSKNQKTLEIKNNEYYIFNDNWDVTVEGKSIIIKEGLRNIHLKLSFISSKLIIIEKLKMNYFGNTLIIDKDEFKINNMTFKSVSFQNANIGMQLDLPLKYTKLSLICFILLNKIEKTTKQSIQ